MLNNQQNQKEKKTNSIGYYDIKLIKALNFTICTFVNYWITI